MPNFTSPVLKDAQTSFRISKNNGATDPSTNLVAVQHKRKRSSGAAAKGDGDSVNVVLNSTDQTTFTWHGRIDGSSGVLAGARAAVFVIDAESGSYTDTSSVSLSAASKLFNIDADRPEGPALLSTAGGAGFLSLTEYGVSGQAASVEGIARNVLGIGDSVVVRSKLGDTMVEQVVLGDSLSVHLDIHEKAFAFAKGDRTVDTLRTNITTTSGMFTDLNLSHSANKYNYADTLGVFVVDAAGNRSGSGHNRLDGPAWGVTSGISFLFDTTAPTLDSTNGDTILPVSTDTITDGSINSGFDNDVNVLQYNLAEALDTLFVTFSGASKMALKIGNSATPSTTDDGLAAAVDRVLDLTEAGTVGKGLTANIKAYTTAAVAKGTYAGVRSGADTLLKTGVHTISFKGKDLAGNLGAELSRTNVYLDVDDIDLVRLFPTKAAFGSDTATRTDTIEEETSKLIFKLSEPADSVLITYTGVSGADAGKARTRRLSGTQLTNTSTEQTLPIDSLAQGTLYQLTVLARDLAGNFTRTDPDTFLYDTSFAVPVIKRFTIAASKAGLAANQHSLAGGEVTLTVTADASTDGSRAAVTYKSASILKIAGGSGVTLTGTGVTDATGGRATLNADDWVTGTRTVTLKDTTGIDTLTVTIVDSTTTGGPFTGALDSSRLRSGSL
jgi:hypothetical protein